MRARGLGGLILAVFLTAGCAMRPPPKLYVLSPATDVPAMGEAPVRAIVRVRLPSFLDRRDIVSKEGRNRLEVNDDNRWGEPLGENMEHVLAEDLTRSLGTVRVVVPQEGRGKAVPYEYLIDLDAYEAQGDRAIMRGRWQLRDLRSGRTVAESAFDLRRAIKPGDYSSIVAALNRNLNDAGRRMADATVARLQP